MRNRNILLGIFSLLFLYAAYQASSVFATFFIALTFAYLLQPTVNFLKDKSGIGYKPAALIIYIIFLVLVVSLLSILVPKFIAQIELLLNKIPLFKDEIQNKLVPLLLTKLNRLDPEVANQLKKMFVDLGSGFGEMLTYGLNMLWQYFRSTVDIVSMCLLLPILLVFFLKDWPEVTMSFRSFIRKIGYDKVNEIWQEVDDLITGFIKGILYVGFIQAILYSFSLSLIGFEFALIFGIISGIATVIPFIGPILAVSSCLMMSILIHGLDYQQILIMIIYGVIQVFDSSFLTPKIVGDKIGLHPTAIIFSVFVASHIIGAAGLLLAIPIAGIIKIVFNKFILKEQTQKSIKDL